MLIIGQKGKKFLLAAVVLLAFSVRAAAAEYGLAMQGAPKYAAGADHLDYVNAHAPKGGTLRMAQIGTFDTLNPFSIKGTAAKDLNYVYDRLMARVWDEPFTLYPLVAQRVEVPADRSGITFHIDPRARFSDGTAVTAEDVLFSWRTLKELGRPNMRRVYKLAAVAEITAPLTVHFAFGPGFDRETVMIFAMMPVLPAHFWQGRNFDATLLTPPVTNGPYRFETVEPGHRVVLARDSGYWARDLFPNRGQYNFDRIVEDYYRDDAVALESFKAGNLNLRREYNAGKWASAYDFPAHARGEVVMEALPHRRPEQARGLIFNTRRPPFEDPRVRRALTYALDADWVNRTLFQGQYKRIASYFPNAALAATGAPSAGEVALLEPWRKSLPADVFGPMWRPPSSGDAEALRANLRRADELLRQAGWIVKDGRRVRADDPAKTFRFEITLGAREEEKVALAFIGELQRLGIEATARTPDAAALTRRLNDYDYDMVLYYWLNSLSPGGEQMIYWGCQAAGQKGRFNYAGICNPAIDALAQSVAGAATPEALADRAHALDRALIWGDYMIPLFYAGKDFVAYRRELHHPVEMPIYGTVLESWWADQPP